MKKESNRIIRTLILYCILALSGNTVKGNQPGLPDKSFPDTLNYNSVQLKIFSWNIGMLPVLELFKSEDERAEAIANALTITDYDIIVFEEAFTSYSRTVINHALHLQYPYSYGPVNGSGFSWKCNSGIWIISKVPLRKVKEIQFTASSGFDSFARKGAGLFEGQFHNMTFQLIVTHLQDDDYPQSIRDQQLHEIFQKLITPFSDELTPQIICGDFNTDERKAEGYHAMLSILNADNGEISGNRKITFDDESNDAFKSVHPDPRLIDYILTRNSRVIQWVKRKITVIKGRWGKGCEYLSDHNGIEATIVFRNYEYLSIVH
jgi:endonuclease/exonuclease/phosphatase family metal-dependent hydrolase